MIFSLLFLLACEVASPQKSNDQLGNDENKRTCVCDCKTTCSKDVNINISITPSKKQVEDIKDSIDHQTIDIDVEDNVSENIVIQKQEDNSLPAKNDEYKEYDMCVGCEDDEDDEEDIIKEELDVKLWIDPETGTYDVIIDGIKIE